MRRLRGDLRLTIAVCALAYAAYAFQNSDTARAGRSLPAGDNILWKDPGDVASLNFVDGVGGPEMAPAGPFQFIQEDLGGTTPKIRVKDAKGRTWSAKFGAEARPSVFSTRLIWACGYNVETEYFVGRGEVQGIKGLKRAAKYIQGSTITDARFQLRTDSPKFLSSYNWAWNSNPFLGTPQLNGLRILTMLLSNWDIKDARDFGSGGAEGTSDSNLGIFEDKGADRPTYLFMVTDWGASLGKWGAALGSRNKGRCRDYADQTPFFVKGVSDGIVRWGWSGKRTDDISKDIKVSDVQWLLQYLGKVTDAQLRTGLGASGATPEELDCYLTSIRQRIGQLQALPQ